MSNWKVRGTYIASIIITMLALALVPIWVKLRSIEIDSITDNYFASTQYDLHAIARQELLVFIASIGVVFLIVSSLVSFSCVSKCIKDLKIYVIMAMIYLFATFFSAVCSENREVAFHGLFCNGEGFISELCYFILLFVAVYATFGIFALYGVKKRGFVSFLFVPLSIVLLVNSMIAILQYSKVDVFSVDFIGRFIAGEDYTKYNFSSAFEPGTVFGIFYNSNYSGVYGVMMIGMFLGLCMSMKHTWMRVVSFIGLFLSTAFTFALNSEGAIVGILAMGVLYSIVFHKELKTHWKLFGGVLLVILLVVIVNAQSVFYALGASVQGAIATIAQPYNRDERLLIDDINIEYASIIFSTDGGDYCVSLDQESSELHISHNQKIVNRISFLEPITFQIADVIFSDVSFEIQPISDTEIYFKVLPNWKFYMNTSGEVSAISGFTEQKIEIDKPSIALKGIEPTLGSNRIYIWSRTIPLIKNFWILGCGPDNFVFQFPQYDLLGREECGISNHIIFLNAHNTYLQILINNGGIAFLAFIGMLGKYLISSLRLYSGKKQKKMEDYIGIGIFSAIFGACVSLFFVDMLIYFAPIFWILFGVGIALNVRNVTNV